MQLDERKDKILKAVVDGYIKTADPVGSRTIAKKYKIGLSSATIRNEMADLEDMGYLEQPHTSAGRIPSIKGYRYYVDSIMQDLISLTSELDEREKYILEKYLFEEISSDAEDRIEEIIKKIAKLLSNVTRYTSLVLAPQLNLSKLKAIKLVPIDDSNILLAILTNTGLVRNAVLKMNKPMDSIEVDRVNNLINHKLSYLTIEEIDDDLINSIKVEFNDDVLLDNVINSIKKTLRRADDGDIFMDGTTNIFNYPEYQDIKKVKNFMSLLEEKELLYEVLQPNRDNDIDITIGSENKFDETKDMSIIIAAYRLNGRSIGSIGIIGPTRMDYRKAIATVNLVKEDLGKLMEYLYGI
ncbi:heat-inducible transcriptional repressor HrcA [Caldanaerobius polysaccharolyticus]|uniref:heat-inducible transcriptional repressor HrcA n=1 Tax=Caldanaerobius polysaccharolyticus TaxID=44256 RepID=UPI00047972AF|nr:heat-inducible transcriptional repressor HrcA [Caldanaerobius polysaccharolyticus]